MPDLESLWVDLGEIPNNSLERVMAVVNPC